MNPVFFPWLISVALISGRDVVNAHRLPFPSKFLASFIAFGILGGLADTQARGPAVMVAWGLDVAMFIAFATKNAGVLSAIGNFLADSGTPTPQRSSSAPPAPVGSAAPVSTVPALPGGTLV